MVIPIRPQPAAQKQSEFEFPCPKFPPGRKYSGEVETQATIMREVGSKTGISFPQVFWDIEIRKSVPQRNSDY
jgi:hypothetical protein